MNHGFKKLDRDNDVVLFDKYTYTVARLNEIVKEQIDRRVYDSYNTQQFSREKPNYQRVVIANTNQAITIPAYATGQSILVKFNESQWSASTQETDCKILSGDGSKGWQTGKLRIKVDVIFFPQEYTSYDSRENLKTEIKIDLEFRPDEPMEPESPLDDLRQTEDYQKLV